jgi:diguanylate cyclase (GGDEF)-like protein/PAS domain S-box-containing protein
VDNLQTLSISYGCESSLGNSLNFQEMSKGFLKGFLKKTSALYASLMILNKERICNSLCSVGKSDFFELVAEVKPNKIDKYAIIEIQKENLLYNCLFLPLENHCLAFVYSKTNGLDIKIIANIFYSLSKKIDIGIKASLEHERIELALIGSNGALWDWNLNNNSIYFSHRWKEMLGYNEDTFSNNIETWSSKVHPSDLKEFLNIVEKNIDAKIDNIENIHRLQHKNGHWIWVLSRGKTHYDKNDKAIRIVGTSTDITADKEMQLKLAHQAQIIEQVHDSVISTDLEGNIVSWNNGSELLFGYKDYEVIGKNIVLLCPSYKDNILEKVILQVIEKGEFSSERKLITKTKKIIFVKMSFSHFKDESAKVTGLVCYIHDITKRKLAEEKLLEQKSILEFQAFHDPLTGLANRALFQNRLELSIEKAKRAQSQIALLFIDLDHFKEINDSLGHDIGDEVLKIVANRFKKIIRKEDTLARLGGDEFTLIIESIQNVKNIASLAQKIIESSQEVIYINSHTINISSSIGISLYPKNATDYQNLLKCADYAMYTAKSMGRNDFKFYTTDKATGL